MSLLYTPIWQDSSGSVGKGFPQDTYEQAQAKLQARKTYGFADRWYAIELQSTVILADPVVPNKTITGQAARYQAQDAKAKEEQCK